MRSASSPEVNAVSSSSRGSTRASLSTPLAMTLNRLISGRAIVVNTRNGGTSHRAIRSGPAIAMFLGTISPSRMCATTTIASDTANASGCSTASGRPTHASGRSSRCATAGSPRRPSRSEQIVMPSCDAASMRERSAPARSTVRAAAVPESAIASSRSRRAEMSANSAPTKNALAASSAIAASSASRSLPTARPPRVPALRCRASRQLRQPVAFAAHHGELPAVDGDLLARRRGYGRAGRARTRRASRTRRVGSRSRWRRRPRRRAAARRRASCRAPVAVPGPARRGRARRGRRRRSPRPGPRASRCRRCRRTRRRRRRAAGPSCAAG